LALNLKPQISTRKPEKKGARGSSLFSAEQESPTNQSEGMANQSAVRRGIVVDINRFRCQAPSERHLPFNPKTEEPSKARATRIPAMGL